MNNIRVLVLMFAISTGCSAGGGGFRGTSNPNIAKSQADQEKREAVLPEASPSATASVTPLPTASVSPNQTPVVTPGEILPTASPVPVSSTPTPTGPLPTISPSPTPGIDELKLLCPADLAWGIGCGQQLEPAVHERAVVGTSDWSLLNTKPGFTGSAKFRCTANGWSFVSGTCETQACVTVGLPPLLVNQPGGPYQNCGIPNLPRTEYQDNTASWSGCCKRLERVCVVNGYSTLNTMKCVP